MKRLILVTAAAFTIIGCAHQAPTRISPQYDPAEYTALQTTGSAVVKGQAFMVTKGGEVRKGAGQTITLRPATSFAERMMIYAGYKSVPGLTYDALKFDRTTTADADGKFEFKDVAAGSYFVAGNVSWSVFYRGTFGPIEEKQGGMIIKKIDVAQGGTIETMLTR